MVIGRQRSIKPEVMSGNIAITYKSETRFLGLLSGVRRYISYKQHFKDLSTLQIPCIYILSNLPHKTTYYHAFMAL
jgi:hypothetical protein